MNLINKEQLLKKQPVKIEDVEVEGIGVLRLRGLTVSQSQKFKAWLRPGGKLDKKRYRFRDLKLMTICVMEPNPDDPDNLSLSVPMFDYSYSKEGNAEFMEFAESTFDDTEEKWDAISYQVLLFNGWIKEQKSEEEVESDELLEK